MSDQELPNEIEEIFEELSAEVSWIHARWIIYNQLFMKQKRIDLLNDSAGTLFYLLEKVLIDDIQMGLCKITDPANTLGKDNLTLEQLRNIIKNKLKNTVLSDDLDTILKIIEIKVAPLIKIRHKTLAHLDLKTRIDAEKNPLPDVTFDDIKELLNLISDFLNKIEEHYCSRCTGYGHFLMIGSDGDALVDLLRFGHRYQELVGTDALDYSDQEYLPYKDA